MEYQLDTVDMSLFRDLSDFHVTDTKDEVDGGFSSGWMLASPISEPCSPHVEDHNPFCTEWLESRVDLLTYLTGLEEPLDGGTSCTLTTPTASNPAAGSVQVLHDVSSEYEHSLHGRFSSPLQQAAAHENGYGSSGAAALEEEKATLDLLDLLDWSVSPVKEVNVDQSLASMSPEDVDFILSSSPVCSVRSECEQDIESLIAICEPESSQDRFVSCSIGEASGMFTLVSGGSMPAGEQQPLFYAVSEIRSASDCGQNYEVLSDGDLTQPLPGTSYSSDESQCSLQSPASSECHFGEAYCRPKPYDRPRKAGSNKGLPREVILQERKSRKKQQNKDAATRYRQKKKAEASGAFEICEALEARSSQLSEQVDDVSREIQYLKDLLVEVYRARGLSLPGLIGT